MTFKKDDQIKCNNPGGCYLTKDKIYSVIRVDGDHVYVLNDKGRENNYEVTRFEKVKLGTVYVNTPIQVGDIVEITKSGYGTSPKDVGKQTTVLAVNGNRIVYDTTGLEINNQTRDSTYTGYTEAFRKVGLDFTKPLFTTEGTSVQLVTTEGRDDKFPVLVYEGTATDTTKYSINGVSKHGAARRNLTNKAPKPEPVEVVTYMNLYSDGTVGNPVKTRQAADDNAATAGSLSSRKRIGVKKIVLVEGLFDA